MPSKYTYNIADQIRKFRMILTLFMSYLWVSYTITRLTISEIALDENLMRKPSKFAIVFNPMYYYQQVKKLFALSYLKNMAKTGAFWLSTNP